MVYAGHFSGTCTDPAAIAGPLDLERQPAIEVAAGGEPGERVEIGLFAQALKHAAAALGDHPR